MVAEEIEIVYLESQLIGQTQEVDRRLVFL